MIIRPIIRSLGIWSMAIYVVVGLGPVHADDTLSINEFMADNDGNIEDPDEPGAYEDWIELYNSGPTAFDLGGTFLTDDLAEPTKWQIPAGVTIAAGGHLLFWADDDEDQGNTHTNFKLGAGGEEIGFYDADGSTEIDSIVFGEQSVDVSYGRCPDGGDDWSFHTVPTPGVENSCDGTSLTFIPAAGLAAGAGGSFWVTDVDLVNAGTGIMTYEFWWLPRGEDNSQPLVSDTYTLNPNTSMRYANILDEVFGLDPADSPFGAIAVSSGSSSAMSMARIFNQAGAKQAGTFGQALPGVAAGDLIIQGETRRIIFMSEDDDFRANLGCQNGTAGDITISFEGFNNAGVSLEVGTVDLAAYSNNQVNRVLRLHEPVNGFVDVWSDTPGAAFFCYGSIIDNETGDPTSILPQ